MDIDILSIIFLQQFRNPIYDAFAVLFDLLFSYPIVLGVLLAFYLAYKKRNTFITLLASFSTFVLTYIIKEIVARPRPGLELSGSLNFGPESTSFPSAHTAIIFTLAIMLSRYYPKYRYVFYTLAVLVSISRIYAGNHYFTDVLAGAILGISVALLFLFKEQQVFNLEAKIHKHLKSTFKL
jgi:undecaprenyl-diphosphatase